MANVHASLGDGSVGLPSQAPFDAILVTAGATALAPGLVDQLAPGGRLVVPVGDAHAQRLLRVRRDERGGLVEEDLGPCAFVPLIGDGGHRAPGRAHLWWVRMRVFLRGE